MAKKTTKKNSLTKTGTDIDRLASTRRNSMQIAPSIEKAMFNAYVSGHTYKQIANDFTQNGYPISAYRVSKISKFYGWEAKRIEMDTELAMKLGDDIERTRLKLLETQNLMITAINDEVKREYDQYVADLADWERGVIIDKPKKPSWMEPKQLSFIQESWFRAQNNGAEKLEVDAKSTMVNMGITPDQVSEMLRVMAEGKKAPVKDEIVSLNSTVDDNGVETYAPTDEED